MDVNADGALTYEEFRSGLQAASVKVGNIHPLLEAIDSDGSGTIDLTEFLSAISAARTLAGEKYVAGSSTAEATPVPNHLQPQPALVCGPEATARSHSPSPVRLPEATGSGDDSGAPNIHRFHSCDRDSDGLLNRRELEVFLRGYGFEVTEAFLDEIFARYGGGANGSGVGLQDYKHLWNHLFHSDSDGVRKVRCSEALWCIATR